MKYDVFPTDPNDTVAVTMTEGFLKTISTSVTPIYDNDVVVSWSIDIDDNDKIRSVRDYTGVKDVRHPNTKRDDPQPGDTTARPKRWIAFAKDPKDHDETNRTRLWLDSNIDDKNVNIIEIRSGMRPDGDVKMWGHLTFTDEKLEEAKKQPGIRAVRNDSATEPGIALKKKRHTTFKRADLQWTKQIEPPGDLALDSQYKGSTLQEEFVYEERAGEGVFIYVVDLGVNVHVKNVADGDPSKEEFMHYIVNDPENGEDFQTLGSKDAGQGPNDDSDEDPQTQGHGTMVASKALGLKYGIAKKATLVNVKILDDSTTMQEAFELIWEDLSEYHKERAAKAVVVISRHIQDIYSSHQAAMDDPMGDALHSMFKDIINLGVPIVCSSNNHAGPPLNRKAIDTIPPILSSGEAPLIVVGAATADGKRAVYSQGEGYVTLYAPGKVKAQTKIDGQEKEVDGTSFAAPVVAGIIATYMNYDPPPWDTEKTKTGKDKVIALRDWLQTDDTSWVRGEQRMIWNGADENAHKNAKAEICKRDSASCSPGGSSITALTCNDIQNKHYMIGETASMTIDQWFCPDAAKQHRPDDNSNSITRTYLQDTMETIELAIDWPSTQSDFTLKEDDCRQYMHKLLEDCDLPTFDHPMHWKAGGNVHVGPGDAVYRWSTIVERQPPPFAPWGKCVKNNFMDDGIYNITGAGWLNTGGSAPLETKLKEKGVVFLGSQFGYGVGDDGREWDYSVQVPHFDHDADVEAGMSEVANYPGFSVKCSA
ncbi:peptidase S8/S53 domain-containing protein [Lophiotrema nucula]|uniref:Peptidase S8/S53 domain-containing protein n=1 Tax=Lophiotrema nucula TaxID=690887 RepID=A0A6A5YEC7_9PLEO|nr:peptidase S8/S53 domain-containing protein [Lophiotrema nucula]